MPTESQVSFSKAMAYVDKVKDRFQGRPAQYAAFLHTMQEHNNRKQTGTELGEDEVVRSTRARLGDIFKNDPDLLEEFEQFVPENLRKNGS